MGFASRVKGFNLNSKESRLWFYYLKGSIKKKWVEKKLILHTAVQHHHHCSQPGARHQHQQRWEEETGHLILGCVQ